MTRPVVVGPGVVVAADVCAVLGPVLGKRLAEAQRNREAVTGDVVETIEAIVRAGEIFRGRAVPQSSTKFRSVDTPGSEPSRWLSVENVASQLGISGRAVRKRCKTGTLAALKVAGAWRIDAASVKEKSA